MLPFLAEYDALVFTMDGFVPPALKHQGVVAMTPAIDPLRPKNMGISEAICQEIRAWRGIDPRRPPVTQVPREECAKRVLFLLRNRDEARRRGLAGRERVRQRFLITRLLADELRLLTSLASAAEIPAPSASTIPDTAASLRV